MITQLLSYIFIVYTFLRHLVQFILFILYFPLLILLGSTWFNLLRGVLEVGGGMVAGIILGFLIQYFPSVDQVGLLLQHYYDIS